MELEETLQELFDYFHIGQEGWPVATVYHGGEFITGIIDDELYEILTKLAELHEEIG